MLKPPGHPYSTRGESGITGLESAIFFIAFIVMTAVFSFMLLSAGVFASDKSKEAVYDGLRTAQQTLNVKGPLVALKDSIDTTGDRIGDTESIVIIKFTLGSTISGESVDLTPSYKQHPTQNKLQPNDDANKTIISFNTREIFISDCAWTTRFIGGNDGDNLLEKGETALITLWIVNYDYHPLVGNYYELGDDNDDPFLDDTVYLLQADETFELQIKPETGATLTLERILPSSLDLVVNLN